MYESFFGLKEKPFNLTPDPRYFYLSESHREALSALIYAVHERVGLVTLTGPVGVGKTMILASFLEQIKGHAETASFSGGFSGTRIDFLRDLCRVLRISPEYDSLLGHFEAIKDFALRKTEEGRSVVVLVDEAQDLTVEALDHFHHLCNLETPETKLLQIVLAGTKKLEEKLGDKSLEALWQRVAIRCVIEPIEPEETIAYIFHRIRVAGGSASGLFSEDALCRIVNYSRGIPRLINLVCNQAMIAAFSSGKLPVTEDAVVGALQEIEVGQEGIETADIVTKEEIPSLVERVSNLESEDMGGSQGEGEPTPEEDEDRSGQPEAVEEEGVMMRVQRRWGFLSWFRPGRKFALAVVLFLLLAVIGVVMTTGLLRPGSKELERVAVGPVRESSEGMSEDAREGETIRDAAPRGGAGGEMQGTEVAEIGPDAVALGRAEVEEGRNRSLGSKTEGLERVSARQTRVIARERDLAEIALEHYGRLDIEILRMLKESNPQVRDWNSLEQTVQFVLPDVPEVRDGGANFYTVQVGAFRSEEGASRRASDLEKRGAQNLFLVKGQGRRLNLVCVGVFESGGQSSGGIEKMKEWGFVDAFPIRIRANRLEDILVPPYDGPGTQGPKAVEGDKKALVIGKFPLPQE